MHRPSRRTVVALLAALVVVAAAVTGYLASRPDPTYDRPVLAGDGTYTPGTVPDDTDAVKAAVAALPEALSSDYRKLDENLVEATSLMTAPFAEEFRSTFEATARKLAIDKKSVTEAHVRAAGLVRSDGDRATCLVFLDQVLVSSETMKNKAQPVRVTQSRVLVDLQKVGRLWKVDGIDPL